MDDEEFCLALEQFMAEHRGQTMDDVISDCVACAELQVAEGEDSRVGKPSVALPMTEQEQEHIEEAAEMGSTAQGDLPSNHESDLSVVLLPLASGEESSTNMQTPPKRPSQSCCADLVHSPPKRRRLHQKQQPPPAYSLVGITGAPCEGQSSSADATPTRIGCLDHWEMRWMALSRAERQKTKIAFYQKVNPRLKKFSISPVYSQRRSTIMSWFTQLHRCKKTAWLDYIEGVRQLPPPVSVLDVPECFQMDYIRDDNAAASPEAEPKPETHAPTDKIEDMRSFSWMITNNIVTNGEPPEDVAQIIDAKLHGRALERALLNAQSVLSLWDEYLNWVKKNCSELGDVKISCKLEVSHDATDPRRCLLHGHVAVTNTINRFRLVTRRRMWDFRQSPAFIVTNKGRGRSANKSIYHNNYYCQVKKIGTLFS